MKLVKACIAMAAFAALFVVPSIASAIELTHPTGTTLAVGSKIETFNVAHSTTPTQFVMTTSIRNLSCGTATITGEVKKNDPAPEVELTTAEIGGTHGMTSSGHCAGSGILGSQITLTPSHTSDETKSLPWCLKAKAEDQFEVRGGKCSEAARPVTFTLHGAITCGYEKASVIGTYTTHPADGILTLANQSFNRSAGSSAFCPATLSLDMALTMTTDGDRTKPIYIDK